MKVFIYFEYNIRKNGKEPKTNISDVCLTHFNLKEQETQEKLTEEDAIKIIEASYKKEKFIKMCEEDIENSLIDKQFIYKIERIELVTATRTKFVKGIYYAHEYNQFTEGEARKISFSNGYTVFIVTCLDREIIVADGIWENLYENGLGDKFQPYKKLDWMP